ncbi:TraG/TraD/VirD4 family protein (plasmid) [Paenarthrobacter sp. R1]|uniref:TraG/TraD/VirD4 family protein n=1 Tax=Paenarthrobacter sp. R1 TaxID=3049085 RepID=UPI0025521FD8|nr:TraG/TraD/VirD4 family protein [Paenarthrobacter sp. R1]WIV33576.1 TraG/TraD/VirD4 family protein [Paenarthrobacter sp. R1]
MAIAEAMEERAERAGGRLPKPALFALDELANVVRWAGLPDQFSHYGSKGLIVMGILQSWSQGVELWGEANMRKIWSAANVKVYGGGVAEEGFLRALSDLIGDYSYINVSASTGKSGSSRSRQEAKERIFDVSNLAELDRGARRGPRLRCARHPSADHALVHGTAQGISGGVHHEVQSSPGEPAISAPAEPVANPWVTT